MFRKWSGFQGWLFKALSVLGLTVLRSCDKGGLGQSVLGLTVLRPDNQGVRGFGVGIDCFKRKCLYLIWVLGASVSGLTVLSAYIYIYMCVCIYIIYDIYICMIWVLGASVSGLTVLSINSTTNKNWGADNGFSVLVGGYGDPPP